MPTNPFLDWNGNVFGITNEALHVYQTGDGFVSEVNSTEVNLAGGATIERIRNV